MVELGGHPRRAALRRDAALARRVARATPRSCSRATSRRSACAPVPTRRSRSSPRTARRPRLQHAHRRCTTRARRSPTCSRCARRSARSRACGSPTSATATTSPARSPMLGTLAGRRGRGRLAGRLRARADLRAGATGCAHRRPARGGRRRARRLHRRVGVSMGDEADRRRAPRGARRLPRRRRAARRRRARRVRAARPARAPRRGDHRRGPLRRAPAHLGPGREPPPRAEGAAGAAGRSRRERLRDLARARRHADGSRARSAATSSSCAIDSLAFGGEGVARLGDGGYVVFVAGAVPGDRVRARRAQAQAQLRHARTLEVLEPSPERIAPRRRPPGRAVAGAALRAPAGDQARSRSTTRCGGSAGSTASSSSRSSRPSSSGATATSSSTPSATRRATATLVCGFHAPGRWERDRADRGLPARLRARQRARACATVLDAGARAQRASTRVRPPRRHAAALPAQPRRARGPPHRRSCRSASSRPRASSTPASSPRAAGLGVPTGLLWTRTDERRRDDGGRRDRARRRARRSSRAARRARASRSPPRRSSRRTPRWPSGSTAIVAEYAALEGWERVYDLYCGIGTIGLTLAPRAGELWGIEIVEQAVADAIANARAQRDRRTPASSPATCASRCASWSSAPGAPTWSSSTRRAPASRRRSCAASSRPSPKRIVYVSCNPTTLAPNAAAARRGRLDAAQRVRPVDMFPQTPHIECVALLERVSG